MNKSMKKMKSGGETPSDSTRKASMKVTKAPVKKAVTPFYAKPSGVKTTYKEVKNPLSAGSTRMAVQTKKGKTVAQFASPKKAGGMVAKAPAKKAKGGKAC